MQAEKNTSQINVHIDIDSLFIKIAKKNPYMCIVISGYDYKWINN